jgi:4-hydroxy-3-polyprenylbenzoate decarboxylase
VDLCVSGAGEEVLAHELGLSSAGALARDCARGLPARARARLELCDPAAVGSRAASGTSLTRAVVVCPCSMGTLARIAAGFSSNLIERAADVALKEGRTLVVVPREAPYSTLHLENMLALARLGAVVLPASPGFYHRPATIDDLVAHLVGKLLDRIGIELPGAVRWQGSAGARSEPRGDDGARISRAAPRAGSTARARAASGRGRP